MDLLWQRLMVCSIGKQRQGIPLDMDPHASVELARGHEGNVLEKVDLAHRRRAQCCHDEHGRESVREIGFEAGFEPVERNCLLEPGGVRRAQHFLEARLREPEALHHAQEEAARMPRAVEPRDGAAKPMESVAVELWEGILERSIACEIEGRAVAAEPAERPVLRQPEQILDPPAGGALNVVLELAECLWRHCGGDVLRESCDGNRRQNGSRERLELLQIARSARGGCMRLAHCSQHMVLQPTHDLVGMDGHEDGFVAREILDFVLVKGDCAALEHELSEMLRGKPPFFAAKCSTALPGACCRRVRVCVF
eukprot:comp10349_c0_seq1/m.12526 comp10349_c0_seq1/g.12526  ORF comp10349_c0_seq1/g.12526 comp10349_c0_seq1/m.12526 type:complete len:310 (+) comp10349_c0_seq1:1378-2307(+)